MMRREEVLRLFGAKPLLVEATKLDAAYGARKPYPVQEGVAVIDIAGVLANEPSLFDAILFGATAYGEILDEVEQAIADPEVRAVLLRVNSPGGDSENAFETADRAGAPEADLGRGRQLDVQRGVLAGDGGRADLCARVHRRGRLDRHLR